MGVVICNTENRKVLINSVRVVAVYMMEFEANPECFTYAAHPPVFGQQALALRLGRLASQLDLD